MCLQLDFSSISSAHLLLSAACIAELLCDGKELVLKVVHGLVGLTVNCPWTNANI